MGAFKHIGDEEHYRKVYVRNTPFPPKDQAISALSVGHICLPEGQVYPTQQAHFSTLIWCEEGMFQIKGEGWDLEVVPNKIGVLAPGSSFQTLAGPTGCRGYYLFVDGPEIDRLLPETGLWQGVFPCNKIPTDWLEWIAEGLADLSRQPGLSTTAHSLFLQAAREAQKSVADPLVWKACQYIQTHWHEIGLNIESIIEHLQTNRTTLSARFKAQTGKTILGYIADIRYRHAYQKIQQETTPIATIAQECGFLDASYFTQWFKKQAGQTPRSVRNGKK